MDASKNNLQGAVELRTSAGKGVFLIISLSLHAALFIAFSLITLNNTGEAPARIIEVSYYAGKNPALVKTNKTKPKSAEITSIIKAEIKTEKEELKTPEEQSVAPALEKKESSVGLSSQAEEAGDGGVYAGTDPESAAWFVRFKEKVERYKRYPRKALEKGIEGKTILRINVENNGTANIINVFYSSGDESLDREAVRTVQAASPFGPLPAKMGKAITFLLPLKFEVRK
ncbi:MAG: energy transducer TonB [Candidatus Firestonebacteria bacterium]